MKRFFKQLLYFVRIFFPAYAVLISLVFRGAAAEAGVPFFLFMFPLYLCATDSFFARVKEFIDVIKESQEEEPPDDT